MDWRKNFFNVWCKRKNSNDINRLARLGWIIEDEEERKLYMHPMVQEIVKEELVPSISKCSVLLNSIHDICLHFGIDVSFYQTLFSMIMSIVEKITVDDMDYWIRFLEDALAYMDKYGDYTNMEITLRELDFILGGSGYGEKEDVALMLDYKAHMCFISNSIDKAIKREKQALKIIPEINQGNALLHSNLNANMGMYYLHKNMYSNAEVHMKLAIEILNTYDVPGYYDIIPQLANYGNLLLGMKMPDEALAYFEVSMKLISDSQGEESSDYGIMLRNIGVAYAEMGNMERALRYFSDSERILLKLFPPDHPQIQLLHRYNSQIGKLTGRVLGIDKRIDMIEQNK